MSTQYKYTSIKPEYTNTPPLIPGSDGANTKVPESSIIKYNGSLTFKQQLLNIVSTLYPNYYYAGIKLTHSLDISILYKIISIDLSQQHIFHIHSTDVLLGVFNRVHKFLYPSWIKIYKFPKYLKILFFDTSTKSEKYVYNTTSGTIGHFNYSITFNEIINMIIGDYHIMISNNFITLNKHLFLLSCKDKLVSSGSSLLEIFIN